jgi:Na+-driven multidrug efflux pump
MFVGNTAAGLFVYALQVVMGRMLEVGDYSLFTALMGVFNVVALPVTALLLVLTRNVALELGRDRPGAAAAVRAQAVRELGLAGGALVLVALVLSGPLASLLDAP